MIGFQLVHSCKNALDVMVRKHLNYAGSQALLSSLKICEVS